MISSFTLGSKLPTYTVASWFRSNKGPPRPVRDACLYMLLALAGAGVDDSFYDEVCYDSAGAAADIS